MTATSLQTIRILLVDDHVVVRTGLHMLIESQPGMQVVGTVGDRISAVAAAEREQPDIILLDLHLGADNGLDFLSELVEVCKARVIVLTGVADIAMHQKAVRTGAAGLILKDQASEVLIRAIERVHAGETWFDRSLMANALAEMAQMQANARLTGHGVDQLSEREREVISLVCEGLQNKSIANRLGISETTVRHHLTSSFSKLDVTDRLELAIFAFRNGLCDLNP